MDINNVCMLQWFGPFKDKKECQDWVKLESEEKEFNFYMLCGKETGQGIRKDSFYCGITRQRFLNRFDDINHPTNTFKIEEIWIARFSDKKLRKLTSDNKYPKNISELIESVEWALIHFLEVTHPSQFFLYNEKKKKTPPKDSIAIINQWYNHNSFINKVNMRYKVQKWMPDVILFDKNEIDDDYKYGLWKISEKMKRIKY